MQVQGVQETCSRPWKVVQVVEGGIPAADEMLHSPAQVAQLSQQIFLSYFAEREGQAREGGVDAHKTQCESNKRNPSKPRHPSIKYPPRKIITILDV